MFVKLINLEGTYVGEVLQMFLLEILYTAWNDNGNKNKMEMRMEQKQNDVKRRASVNDDF